MSTRKTPHRTTWLRLDPAGLEDGGDVSQRLLGLRLDVVGQVAGLRVASGLAGHEDEVADDDAGGIGADRCRQLSGA